jgi:2-keto-4-pentenoate hydratase/2-oxohepta-3-ene-1,7-dioic acid hydratase in catechol pathway
VEQDGEPLAVISVGEALYPLADGRVTVLEVLDDWAHWSGALGEIADALGEGSTSVPTIPPPTEWLAPILHPRKVIGIGANYKDHLDFAGIPYPDTPYLFLKPA